MIELSNIIIVIIFFYIFLFWVFIIVSFCNKSLFKEKKNNKRCNCKNFNFFQLFSLNSKVIFCVRFRNPVHDGVAYFGSKGCALEDSFRNLPRTSSEVFSYLLSFYIKSHIPMQWYVTALLKDLLIYTLFKVIRFSNHRDFSNKIQTVVF